MTTQRANYIDDVFRKSKIPDFTYLSTSPVVFWYKFNILTNLWLYFYYSCLNSILCLISYCTFSVQSGQSAHARQKVQKVQKIWGCNYQFYQSAMNLHLLFNSFIWTATLISAFLYITVSLEPKYLKFWTNKYAVICWVCLREICVDNNLCKCYITSKYYCLHFWCDFWAQDSDQDDLKDCLNSFENQFSKMFWPKMYFH